MKLLIALLMLLVQAVPAAAQFGGLERLARGAKVAADSASALKGIGEEQEIEIGRQLAATLLGAAPLVADNAVQAYVSRVGSWLAQRSERPGLAWTFGVVDTPSINAWAMPGGYVLITRGLYERLRSESELAGVLAHEIAHVVQRHQLKALQSSLGTAALSSGLSLASGSNAGVNLAAKVVAGGKQLFLRGLDQNDEYEADAMGTVIAARGGYSPYGLVGVLQTLDSVPSNENTALFLKTHPAPAARLLRLGEVMDGKLDRLANAADDTRGFQLLRNPPPPAVVAKPAAKPVTRPRARAN